VERGVDIAATAYSFFYYSDGHYKTVIMAGLDMMHIILYAAIVVGLAVVGYYAGKMHSYPWPGAGIGAAVGVLIAGGIYMYTGSSSATMAYAY
jgi:hypothetical protein